VEAFYYASNLTCTSQYSPFHRSLQGRQRVNSCASQRTSPLSGLLIIPACRTCRFWASDTGFPRLPYGSGFFKVGGLSWAKPCDFTLSFLPLLPITIFRLILYKDLGEK